MSDKNLNEWLFADIDDLIDCDYSNESKVENRMIDKEIIIEKTFSEELPYFKERIKEVFDNYNNPNGNEDHLYICVLRDSNRIVRKAEKEITRQQSEIEKLKECPKCIYEYDGNTAEYCIQGPCSNFKTTEQVRTEAYKEFAVRLKCGVPQETGVIRCSDIDNLVKELVGDTE